MSQSNALGLHRRARSGELVRSSLTRAIAINGDAIAVGGGPGASLLK